MGEIFLHGNASSACVLRWVNHRFIASSRACWEEIHLESLLRKCCFFLLLPSLFASIIIFVEAYSFAAKRLPFDLLPARKLACVSVYLWATHSAATVTSCCCCRVEYAIIEELLIWLKCEPSQSTPEQQQRRIKMKQVQEGIFFNDPNLYELIYGQNRCGGSGSPAFDQLKRGGDIHLPIDTCRYSTMAWIFHAESYDLMDGCRTNLRNIWKNNNNFFSLLKKTEHKPKFSLEGNYVSPFNRKHSKAKDILKWLL